MLRPLSALSSSVLVSFAGHSIGYNKLSGRPISLFDGNKTFAERISPSSLCTSSWIRPSLQYPLGNSSLISTTSPIVAKNVSLLESDLFSLS